MSTVAELTATLAKNAVAGGAIAAAALVALAGQPAQAQDWPQEDITIVVAYPAGGGTDAAIRAMVDILSEQFGQNVLVRNVGGAGGGVAAAQVMREDPDGYTLLATNSTSITLAPLVEPTAYSLEDFETVAILGEFQNAVFANNDKPFDTLDEAIETVKSENRPLSFASQLAIDRLLMQYIARERGIELLPLPVSGGAGATQAVLAGDVDLSFSGGSWAPLVNAGDAKALFAASHGRLAVMPDLVSMEDLGFEFGVTSHISLHAPAGTPEEVLQAISNAFEPGVKGERAQNVGEARSMDMTFRGLEEAREVIANERATYEAMLESLGEAADD
ncbi:tripartite tricarboxylate transporter substrate binding protein [Pararhodobacter sp. SW119]|uniref:tripartite tricarboxylate transporter substrate binding protein n=1 Tax=Pararhodobacter sp. SW119 TaxID=2780075 RepID=UPI001AE02AFE|nr:tripartite tricarboxylate transporter substrate binding protein [Pararhodobacter sp. SW119]